ncbi:MAG TPA: flagellar filament capping protein FliD [Burkholderiaceae bacterium]|nr:flagellar filament capping protein FliD [Burkholderiaceae bacterium]
MASPITASSAIDVQGMVASLLRVERRPLEQMKVEATKIDTKISAWGKIQSQIAKFRDAAADLSRLETWRAVKASSTDPSSVEVTVKPGARAARNVVEVQQLAQAQTLTSGRFANVDAVIGGGTLKIQLGTQPSGPTSFTADAARPEASIAIPAGATLAQVRDAINGANAGVRASIVRDGDQVRLFVTGTGTGASEAFRMTVDGDEDGASTDAAGLSALAFDPVAAAGAGRNLTFVKGAQDALYTIDDVELTSRTNRIVDAIDGVDLVLRKPTAAPVTVDTTVDAEGLQKSVRRFVDAYNELNKLLAEQTKYDEATKTAGALQGDRSAVGLLSQVRAIVRESVTGGSLARLSDVGVELQRDGSLSLKTSTFEAAATDPTRLERFFAGAGGGVGATDRGLMLRFRELGDRLIGTEGAVPTATESWQTRLAANRRRQEALEDRLTDVEKRLLRQYTSLDAQLAAAQANSAALNSALAALPKIG